LIFTHTGYRGSKRHRIPDPDPGSGSATLKKGQIAKKPKLDISLENIGKAEILKNRN
jgi:hypothetical protein